MELYDGIYKSLRNSIMASKKGGYDFTYNAPTLIIVANKKGYGNAMADCACALENMMLAAASLNIGTCWVNQLHWLDDNSCINNYLLLQGLADDETICGALVVGYKGDSKEQIPLQRRGNSITYVR
jgi:nitroreductase